MGRVARQLLSSLGLVGASPRQARITPLRDSAQLRRELRELDSVAPTERPVLHATCLRYREGCAASALGDRRSVCIASRAAPSDSAAFKGFLRDLRTPSVAGEEATSFPVFSSFSTAPDVVRVGGAAAGRAPDAEGVVGAGTANKSTSTLEVCLLIYSFVCSLLLFMSTHIIFLFYRLRLLFRT